MVFIIYMYILYIYIPRHMLVGGAITISKNDCSFVNGVGMTFFHFLMLQESPCSVHAK